MRNTSQKQSLVIGDFGHLEEEKVLNDQQRDGIQRGKRRLS